MLNNQDAVIAKIDTLIRNAIVLQQSALELKTSYTIEVERQLDRKQTHLVHFARGAYHMGLRCLIRDHLDVQGTHLSSRMIWGCTRTSAVPVEFTPWLTHEQLLEQAL